MMSEATAAKPKRSNAGWLMGLYFGLGLRPVTFLLSYAFSGPVAFGIAMFVMQLLAYPLFLRNGPRTSWARNWGFWQFAVLAAVAAVVAYFFSRAFFPNP
jgi:uncharacterized membrane protein